MNMCLLSGRAPGTPSRQRGLVVVELAIVLPLVILIMFITVEFGRAFFQYTTLTKAVEAGTRYYASALNDPNIIDTDKIPTTENLVITAHPTGGAAGVLPAPGITNVIVSNDGEHVRVSADYRFSPIVKKLPIFGWVPTINMTATHTMRAL